MEAVKFPLVIVAAVAQNGVIGVGNRLPWHLPGELKQFRARTLGHPLLMGRKTYQSIGRALPGRETIVVTRDADFRAAGVHVAHNLVQGLAMAEQFADKMAAKAIMVVGGAQLYAALMPHAQRMIITEVAAKPRGDSYFPVILCEQWQEMERIHPIADARDEASYAIVEYRRIAGST